MFRITFYTRGCPSQQGEVLMPFRLRAQLIIDVHPFREKQLCDNYTHMHVRAHTHTHNLNLEKLKLDWSLYRLQSTSWFHIMSDSCQLELDVLFRSL